MNAPEVESLSLYSERCLLLLRQALEHAHSKVTTRPSSKYQSRYADSSSSSEEEEEEDEDGASSSSTPSENEDSDEQRDTVDNDLPQIKSADVSSTEKKQKKRTKSEITQRQREALVRKHFQTLACAELPLPAKEADRESITLKIPAALLSRTDRALQSESDVVATQQYAKAFCDLAASMGTPPSCKPVVVLFLRTGRFAGAVFSGADCVAHRTLQRYTVRKGQGKAQSAQDSSSRANSMGAQLRRAGEVALQQDVTQTLVEWQDYMQQAALIFVSCPKTMKKNLFTGGAEQIWNKDDQRIRRVPLDMGRPTFDSVCLIHSIMTNVNLVHSDASLLEPALMDEPSTSQTMDSAANGEKTAIEDERSAKVQEKTVCRPLSELHIAASKGDVESLRKILATMSTEDDGLDVNQTAGELWMTALHYASESTATEQVDAAVAGECITLLLEQGHANPCIVDSRNRPPYFLASHEKVREAFRIARANLGEDYCRWDDSAKVGPPLTADSIQSRKEKEAEKRRKKKARQKEKKAREKAQVAEAEQARKEEEERLEQENAAKRIRDGLQPRASSSSGNACDFCQTVCKGRRRNQMFKRLEYSYCSTDCVQKHKRELMAAAALARFGGS